MLRYFDSTTKARGRGRLTPRSGSLRIHGPLRAALKGDRLDQTKAKSIRTRPNEVAELPTNFCI